MRADAGLPFLLQFENVARYEAGKVVILDRRKYPRNIEYVTCATYQDVAQAIADMVTQSYGPWVAAAYGMASAARSIRGLNLEKARAELERAADVLSHARPTTSSGMKNHINRILASSIQALESGQDVEACTAAAVDHWLETRYFQDKRTAAFAVSLFPDPVRILTQCFAETYIGYTLLLAREAGKQVSLICPETRPYLQGARLTASVARDMDIPVTVITDNMPGYVLSQGKVDVFVCAADVVTLDGYVVNKVGTFQIALAAHAFNVPFYVLRDPSPGNPTIKTVKIEERDPEEVTHAMGVRTVMEGVCGYYPAFDITPPNLVSAVITSKGIFSPYDCATFADRPSLE
jgi:methylthioribose-1-phosphate isomerase